MHSKLLLRFRPRHASDEVQGHSLDAHQPLLSLYGFLDSCACIFVEESSVIPQHGRVIQPLGYDDWLRRLREHRSGQSDIGNDSRYDEEITESF